jgi:hypothetical protein
MRLSFEAFRAVHPGLFGQILVMRLFKDKNIPMQRLYGAEAGAADGK